MYVDCVDRVVDVYFRGHKQCFVEELLHFEASRAAVAAKHIPHYLGYSEAECWERKKRSGDHGRCDWPGLLVRSVLTIVERRPETWVRRRMVTKTRTQL